MTSASDLPRSIGAPDWLGAPATQKVMAVLTDAGGEGSARFVGGCVRNSLMGGKVDDIDIATPLTPERVIAAAEAAGLRAVPTGVEHGTVTVIVKGQPFEVTTLRRDVSTDGRRAVVAFTSDWREDAQRRDFRFNALYADETGRLYDPTGAGVADAMARRVVFVGDARTRIREDYLRILRYFRFLACYGDGQTDPEALAACTELRDALLARTAERTSKEVLKLMAATDPRRAVRLMAEAGVLAIILPDVDDRARFERMVEIDGDPELRLAALLPADPAVAARVAKNLRLSNALRDRLIAAAGQTPRISAEMTPREARRAIFRLGAGAFSDRVKLAWSASGETAAESWRNLLSIAERWTPPVFPLGGADVMAAGIPKGPKLGAALREIEDWWVDEDFPEGRDAALARLSAIAAEGA